MQEEATDSEKEINRLSILPFPPSAGSILRRQREEDPAPPKRYPRTQRALERLRLGGGCRCPQDTWSQISPVTAPSCPLEPPPHILMSGSEVEPEGQTSAILSAETQGQGWVVQRPDHLWELGGGPFCLSASPHLPFPWYYGSEVPLDLVVCQSGPETGSNSVAHEKTRHGWPGIGGTEGKLGPQRTPEPPCPPFSGPSVACRTSQVRGKWSGEGS